MTGPPRRVTIRAMSSGTLFAPVALVYYACFLLLAGLTLCVAGLGSRRTRARPRLRRTFFLLALSILLWQFTLFLEVRTGQPAAQLYLGRANFAAVVFAAYLALRFVQQVAARETVRNAPALRWLLAGTLLLALLTLLTPLVSAAERVEAGRAITTYGPLFPGYLVHVVGCLAAAVHLAFRERRRARDPSVRAQLTLIAVGTLATSAIGFVTNALLPYAFGYFRFCDAGTLSTLLFVLAVAYATFVHRLFELRIIVRETLVYGLLLAFVLGAYSSAVFVISQYLTESAEKVTQFVVLLIAFSFDPVRRWLEEQADHLLFGGPGGDSDRPERRRTRRRCSGGRLTLALLFPWRRQ